MELLSSKIEKTYDKKFVTIELIHNYLNNKNKQIT